MDPLATEDDLTTYGYDVAAAPFLVRASTRVYGYLSGRMSAAGIFTDAPVLPAPLVECVCAIASRMSAATASAIASGVRSEGSNMESVTYGVEAYAGVSSLTGPEKVALDGIYRRALRSVDIL